MANKSWSKDHASDPGSVLAVWYAVILEKNHLQTNILTGLKIVHVFEIIITLTIDLIH